MRCSTLLGLAITLLAASPASANDNRLAAGRAQYMHQCAVCHGSAAAGDGPMAMNLVTPPPDLTGLAARNNGEFPEAAVERFVAGRDDGMHLGRAMPRWGALWEGEGAEGLGKARAKARMAEVIAYLRSIQKPADQN